MFMFFRPPNGIQNDKENEILSWQKSGKWHKIIENDLKANLFFHQVLNDAVKYPLQFHSRVLFITEQKDWQNNTILVCKFHVPLNNVSVLEKP